MNHRHVWNNSKQASQLNKHNSLKQTVVTGTADLSMTFLEAMMYDGFIAH